MLVSQGGGTSRQETLPGKNKSLLEHWMWRNLSRPYPSRDQMKILAEKAGMSENQVKDWFANTRRELRKDPEKWRRRFSARVARAIDSTSDLHINQVYGNKATIVAAHSC